MNNYVNFKLLHNVCYVYLQVECQVWCPSVTLATPASMKTPLSTSQFEYSDLRYNQASSYKYPSLKMAPSESVHIGFDFLF